MDETTKLTKLLNALEKHLGKKAIIYDEINLIYNIDYVKLTNKFPHEQLIKYCNKKNITLNSLVSFLDENDSNKSSNKIGKAAILFRLKYEMYDIRFLFNTIVIDGHSYDIAYGYDWLNNHEIKEKIGPERLAFMVADLMAMNIESQFSGLLNTEVEKVDNDTKFRYDIAISLSNKILEENNMTDDHKIVIVIEIQENNNNHKFNPNDNVKNYTVDAKGIVIKYFFESKIKETDYEANFYAMIMHICYEILIAVSKNYRNKNIFAETQLIAKKEIIKLTEELEYVDIEQREFININIERCKMMIDDLDNTTKQVKKIYKYKMESYENTNKIMFYDYNIPLDLVLDNLDIKLKKSKKYYDELNKLVSIYCRSINNKLFFSYNSVNNFIVELNIDGIYDLKINFNNTLIYTEKIYEYFIDIIQKYNESIIFKLRNDNKVIKDIITEKIESKFNTKIIKNEINNNIKDYQIKNLMTVLGKKNIKISKKLTLSLEDNTIFIKELNLPIYFSQDRDKKINSVEVLAIMLNEGLKKNESIKLLNKFYKIFNDCRKLEFIENETIQHLYHKINN
jgi:hypothetical protein